MYVITEESTYNCPICNVKHFCGGRSCNNCEHKAYEFSVVFFEPLMGDAEAKVIVAKAINRSIAWLHEKVYLPGRLEVSAFMLASLSDEVWNPPFDAHMLGWTHEIGDEIIRAFTHRENCLKCHGLIGHYYNWHKVVSEGLIRISVVVRRGGLAHICPTNILDPVPVEDVSDREDPCLLKHNVECSGISRYGKFESAALEQTEAGKLFVFRNEQEIPRFYTHWSEMLGMGLDSGESSDEQEKQEESKNKEIEQILERCLPVTSL